MRTVKYLLILTVLLSLVSGCAGTGGKDELLKIWDRGSVDANQTLSYSVQLVDAATVRVLDQMEIMILEDDQTSSTKTIKAATIHLDILIELETLNPESTRMKVGIKHAANEKDKSTASAIIEQTLQTLANNQVF